MPVNATNLLKDLQKWVTRFENDLRERCKEVPELEARLKEQYDAAREAKRTAHPYATWKDDALTQSAVAWVLSCTFVRFLEDNELLETPFLSGPGELRDIAGETRAAYFSEHREHSDDDYLRHAFHKVAALPGMGDLFDERHNELWNAGISGDAAKDFIEFWRRIDPDSGGLAHDFRDPDWGTRFLGDLYQSLSERARKRFALLQTPDFVEEFILDRTLEPAIETFGYEKVRLIDPTCGSGHFLLGTLERMLARWQKGHPELDEREVAAKALDAVYGVDINPFAVAVARFRLLLAAWRFCGVKKMRSAPDFRLNLAVGDSLIHGRRFRRMEGETHRQATFEGDEALFADEMKHVFEVEDRAELHRILGQQYHAVVGNPPYITVKDKALNQAYRVRYASCYRAYALSVPFMERFFDLALSGSSDGREPAGFAGQITSNSFMKREFGKELIVNHIPRWDLTHVIDTSGAYIPGHGTPTVILFGRNAKPATGAVRSVMGIKGEPATPDDPAKGLVWSAIVDQIDRPGSESDFVSCADTIREKFHKHPWSIGGGGAAELREQLQSGGEMRIKAHIKEIGFGAVTREDDVFVSDPDELRRSRQKSDYCLTYVEGDRIRDFQIDRPSTAIWPYDKDSLEAALDSDGARRLWPYRVQLSQRVAYGQTQIQRGLEWFEYSMFFAGRYRVPLSIAFAFVATHNHFVLDRGGKVFNRSAPVIKLPPDATEDDHLLLLGILNSSAACFWMKQVFYPKATATGDISTEKGKPEANRYEIAGTGLKNFPIPEAVGSDLSTLLSITRELDQLGRETSENSGQGVVRVWASHGGDLGMMLTDGKQAALRLRRRMVYLQEELDWLVYALYDLIDERFDVQAEVGIEVDARPFAWDSDDSPSSLPTAVEDTYSARRKLINSSSVLQLIENRVCKRLWLGRQGVYGSASGTYEEKAANAVGEWLSNRLETYCYDSDRMFEGDVPDGVTKARGGHDAGGSFALTTVNRLANAAKHDPLFMEAAATFTGAPDFDVEKLVKKLVLAAAVPALPAQCYKPAGLRKRHQWEQTWELQRAEDAIDAKAKVDEEGITDVERHGRQEKADARKKDEIGDIPVPPKYKSTDFQKSVYWKLRGKLDVPKERFVLYPGAEGGWDDSPVIAWAGWDHAQQAQALSGYLQKAHDTWAFTDTQQSTLLAGLKDLLPWLHQWHNEIDPTYNDRLSKIYQTYYEQKRHDLRLTDDEVEAIRIGEDS